MKLIENLAALIKVKTLVTFPTSVSVAEEQIKVINHRISDLECKN